jgi:hypothetical protein
MNQKTTYELKITDKLQELPLPDLQDAIWARIERTLDSDMPTDDGGGDSGPGTPFGGGGATGVGAFVFSLFFVAAVTAFIIFKTAKPSSQGPAPDNTPAFELRAPSNQNEQPPPGSTALPRNNAPARTANPAPVAGDSALGTPLVATPPPGATDTTAGANSTAAVQQPPVSTIFTPVDTTGVKKKTRGAVVNPDDYRIVPKKDSVRQ